MSYSRAKGHLGTKSLEGKKSCAQYMLFYFLSALRVCSTSFFFESFSLVNEMHSGLDFSESSSTVNDVDIGISRDESTVKFDLIS